MTNYEAALRAQLITLQSALKSASGYSLNTQLVIQCDIIRDQIYAIEEEIDKEKISSLQQD